MLHRIKLGAMFAATGAALAFGIAPASAEEPVGRVGNALAHEQIAQGRLTAAEHALAARNTRDARDPGRLINLAVVYGRTGRIDEARNAFAAAAAAPEEVLIAADGREISSRDLAREGMNWLQGINPR